VEGVRERAREREGENERERRECHSHADFREINSCNHTSFESCGFKASERRHTQPGNKTGEIKLRNKTREVKPRNKTKEIKLRT
jgi:hypothetical protein